MLSYYQFVNVFHILIVFPLLTYIAYKGYYDEPICKWWYVILFIIALLALISHVKMLFFRK